MNFEAIDRLDPFLFDWFVLVLFIVEVGTVELGIIDDEVVVGRLVYW